MKRSLLGVAGLVSLAAACGCSSGMPDQVPSPAPTLVVSPAVSAKGTTSAPAATGDAAEGADAADGAVRAYRAMWADMVEAGTTADYRATRLGDHATSQAWQLLYGGLMSAHDDGVVLRGEPTFTPRVTGLTPADHPVAVSIVDCMDSTRWREYSAATGSLRDDKPGGKHHATATVGLLQGAWKVTQLHVDGVGTCT